MNRRERVEAVVRLEGIAAAATERAAQLRQDLETEARTELAEQGSAPSWRLPGLGTVTLAVTREAAYVADPAVFMAWVKARFPGEIVEQVRPSFQTALLAEVICDGEACECHDRVAVHPGTGEIVPGLAVRPGGLPRSLSFRMDRQVKAEAVTDAEAIIGGLIEPAGRLQPSDVDGDQ